MRYVHTHKKGGRAYNYLRLPPDLQAFVEKNGVRLSDDPVEAAKEASQIVLGQRQQHTGEPSKHERRCVSKMLSNSLARANKRGLSHSLTTESVMQILRQQNYRCALSKLPFDLSWNDGRGLSRNAFALSLDRIDCKRGYEPENCRIILSALNYAINEWGLDTYLQIAKATLAQTARGTNGAQRL